MAQANPFSLQGKTALVAGASRGIGQAVAEGLARAGARVILAARSVKALERIAASLREEGCQAVPLEMDIASRASRLAAAEAAGGVDILINVAGTNVRKNFADFTPEEYDRLLNTNLTGIFELTQAVGRGMIERGRGGKIIMIGSLTSILGVPYVTVYTVTKAARPG